MENKRRCFCVAYRKDREGFPTDDQTQMESMEEAILGFSRTRRHRSCIRSCSSKRKKRRVESIDTTSAPPPSPQPSGNVQ